MKIGTWQKIYEDGDYKVELQQETPEAHYFCIRVSGAGKTSEGRASGISKVSGIPSSRKATVPAGVTDATHVLCGVIVRVEAKDALQAAIDQARQSPAAIRASLHADRDSIVCAVGGALDEWSAAREQAFGADTGRGWDKVKAAEQKMASAEKALQEFDAAHPEIVAEIEAERKAATERFGGQLIDLRHPSASRRWDSVLRHDSKRKDHHMGMYVTAAEAKVLNLPPLELLKHYSTRYELTMSKGGNAFLVCYSSRRGRRAIMDAVRARAQSIIGHTGTDQIAFAARADDGATMGEWSIQFSGRTQRDAYIAGELPYVGGACS